VKIHRTADDFLQDIVDWGEWAARHTASLTREQFMSDEKSQDAVSKCISNVGEAANKVLKLDPTIMERFPEFEAEKAYAARNVISHDYFALDAAVLWATVKQAIPKFIADARRIIQMRKNELVEKNDNDGGLLEDPSGCQ
jgi:uncharacterized protein with HEPN domain